MRAIAPRLAAFTLSAALSSAPFAASDDDASRVLVKVDGAPITTLHLALFASQTGRTPQEPEAQIQMLNELVNNFMVANSAEGRQLANEPEITAALEVARARLLAQAFVRSEINRAPTDEASVQALYDELYGGVAKKEYKARHILVNSQDAAREVIKALDGGAEFATLAEKHSIGPSKSVGGDLGWFEADQMVGEFSAATEQLADGSYSKEPVKTQFGWHVILREESREVPAPSLEEAKPELEQQIKQEYVAAKITRIREQANIEVQRLEPSE